jgi:hypothetical protein
MKVLGKPESLDRELEYDAVAIYQVADDLYTHQRYRIERLEAGGTDLKSEISNLRSQNQVEH